LATGSYGNFPLHCDGGFFYFRLSREKDRGEHVCDLKAYVSKQGKEELLLDSVNHIRSEGGEVTVRNFFGEEKKVRGEVREVSLAKSRVVVEEA